MNNQAIQSIKTNETFADNPTPSKTHYLITKPADSVAEFISNWQADFTERMRTQANSKKRNWTYSDAVGCTSFITQGIDKLMIKYVDYIDSNPLMENDYYRYVDSYIQGKKLDEYYFKHDLSKLKDYYKKVDKAKERDEPYNAFSISHWREYVLYMMLKLEGLYSTEYDAMFRISRKDDRENNPITKIANEMRPYLPFKIKEYDISQANPTFLLMELKIPYFDVYDCMGTDRAKAKSEFNALINFHKDVKGITIESTRSKLKQVFKERTNEVITQERFDNKGQMYRDLTKYERKYIELFVKDNELNNYVRLHDGVVVRADVNCDVLEFDSVIFKEKEITKPEVINIIRNWYEYNGEHYETSPSQYKNWFIQEGFMRITEKERDEMTIIKNRNKILSPYNHITDINALLANHINAFDISNLENQIASDTGAIQDGFKLMEAVPYKLHRDTKDEVFIPFKNGVAKITADEVVMIPYDDDSIGLFAEHETQTRNFDFKPEYADRTYFKDFLINAVIGRDIQDNPELTDEESDKVHAFMTMIGYLVSNYKDPSNAFAIILSDEGANDEHRR